MRCKTVAFCALMLTLILIDKTMHPSLGTLFGILYCYAGSLISWYVQVGFEAMDRVVDAMDFLLTASLCFKGAASRLRARIHACHCSYTPPSCSILTNDLCCFRQCCKQQYRNNNLTSSSSSSSFAYVWFAHHHHHHSPQQAPRFLYLRVFHLLAAC